MREFEYIISLGSMLHFESLLSDDGDFYDLLTSESGFRRRELHTIVEIVSISLESSFFLRDRKCDIEISSTISSTMSFTSNLHTHTVFDSGRDVDIFFDTHISIFFPMAVFTFFYDFLASSTTVSTLSLLFHDAENGLHTLSYSTISMTVFTGICFSSFSMTSITRSTFFIFDFSSVSPDRIFEGYTHPDLDIIPDICSFATLTSSESSSEK